ncbi:ankyrin repeat domain-containing protein [Bacteriovoracaceae bacterium]|nr:ankyrin repeat domain-containing protein [Bacteriovoracaceae bacterium]
MSKIMYLILVSLFCFLPTSHVWSISLFGNSRNNETSKINKIYFKLIKEIDANNIKRLKYVFLRNKKNINFDNEIELTKKNDTLLIYAVRKGCVDAVRFFISQGADIDHAKSNTGITPIYLAAQNGEIEVLNILLVNGGDVNQARTDNGGTPLYIAAQIGNVEIVDILIQYNATIDKARTDYDETPLFVAVEKGSLIIVDTLITNGADVNKVQINGTTPLHLAVLEGHLEVVETLIKHGSKINLRNGNGISPLHIAAQVGDLRIATALVKNDAILHQVRTDNGETPLFSAVKGGHFEVVKYLLKCGARITFKNSNEESILDLAKVKFRNNYEIHPIRTLLEQIESYSVKLDVLSYDSTNYVPSIATTCTHNDIIPFFNADILANIFTFLHSKEFKVLYKYYNFENSSFESSQLRFMFMESRYETFNRNLPNFYNGEESAEKKKSRIHFLITNSHLLDETLNILAELE